MAYNFAYSNPKYRQKQAQITKKNWQLGVFDFKIKPKVKLICLNPKCSKFFYVKPHYLKIRKYCSSACSATVNNCRRMISKATGLKISQALKGTHLKTPRPLIPRLKVICQNSLCQKVMLLPPWQAKIRKFCSNACAMKVIGGKTTSPKASKGKSGIRNDIDPNICFYSTWEANIARVYNLIGIKWLYAPKIFNLGEHTYRPDFYLPDFNTYIEVKNYMGDYSLKRDQTFRKRYSKIKLELILKNKYLDIKSEYKYFIKNWEY